MAFGRINLRGIFGYMYTVYVYIYIHICIILLATDVKANVFALKNIQTKYCILNC